jgi:hypothetical protein
MRNIVSDEE